ncbi:MAG TPA: class I SAM-dependent methyltransferase [Lysobacter sp.]
MDEDRDMPRQAHWEGVYRRKDAEQLSWFRPRLEVSLALMEQAGLGPQTRVIDVGGGTSTLVDDLLALGLIDITVLDLSSEALEIARNRLGDAGRNIHWMAADLLDAPFAEGRFDLWHDRAVLHFLSDEAGVRRYAEQAARAVTLGGHAVIGGFGTGGPERCSGLPVERRSATEIAAALGPAFELIGERNEVHHTPAAMPQAFAYALLRRR